VRYLRTVPSGFITQIFAGALSSVESLTRISPFSGAVAAIEIEVDATHTKLATTLQRVCPSEQKFFFTSPPLSLSVLYPPLKTATS